MYTSRLSLLGLSASFFVSLATAAPSANALEQRQTISTYPVCYDQIDVTVSEDICVTQHAFLTCGTGQTDVDCNTLTATGYAGLCAACQIACFCTH
jgi:hypothetical protein